MCEILLKELEISKEDVPLFTDMIQKMFFKDGNFIANNIVLYPYQTTTSNKSSENLARFLFSVFGINKSDCSKIENAKDKLRFSVLENMIINAIESKNEDESDFLIPYYQVKNNLQEKFKNDFYYMLETGMTSLEDLSNL